VRWLSGDEEKRLRAALKKVPGYLQAMTLLVMNTGLRRGEVFQLTGKDVDLQRRSLTMRAAYAKASKVRHIPLNDEAMSVLRVRAQDDGLIFPGKDGRPMTDVKKSWASLMEAAKITDFRFHDLRHHFASKLVMAGVDLNTVASCSVMPISR
jgi:integrase